MSGPIFPQKTSVRISRLTKEKKQLTEENILLRCELGRLFEEREGKPCDVTLDHGRIVYQLTMDFDAATTGQS